jgi:hypothetical protein
LTEQSYEEQYRQFWRKLEEKIARYKSRRDIAFLSNLKRDLASACREEPSILEYARVSLAMLDEIPSEVRCDCCHQRLKHSYERRSADGAVLTLGKECINHELGACRK